MDSESASERPPNFESNSLVNLVKQRGCSMAILLLVVPPLLMPLAFMMKAETRASFAVPLAVAWLFISIPVSILVFLDWFRSPSTGRLGRSLRNIARVPVLLFGVLAVLIGVGVLTWIAYNLLIERQAAFRWASFEIVSAMASVTMFGVYLIRVSFRNQETDQPSPSSVQPPSIHPR